ncbi:MAG: sigma-54-dependent Fis family transcriptional regulator [Gammaproteobacteria bacterium]|nr:sigma-54-dependent Fis family transcriptional regulator [Gammaproteobacteria bacterium]MBI5619185.1 sigma-54-dependent Fis family transcriptional regulator [Gammaproteobacteria bacterium]
MTTEALRELDGFTDFPQLDERTLATLQSGLRLAAAEDPKEAEADAGSGELFVWGESPSMMHLYEMVERVAPTRANVLLIGESGTGKEVVAQRLHQRSQRPGKPFIAINCGAIPAGLIEAELFGHERGSFTGAVRGNKGVFERAGEGTLFLDEVTEMPLEMQAKLLRVLETGRFYRVGGDTELATRCRIVAATNRHPEQAVVDGVLRADLLYRLAVFPLRLPALRERGSDIDLIADRFVEELNAEYCARKRLSADARRFLHEHAWPGNVRELKNSIHRAYILADEELDLAAVEVPSGPLLNDDDRVAVRIGTSIADMEYKLIMATLARCEGNKRQAAKILGISLKTLYNRLTDYERFARTAGQFAA